MCLPTGASSATSAPSPSAIEEILFYDHPSVENRIRMGMEWKATHPANAPAPAAVAPAAAAPTPTP